MTRNPDQPAAKPGLWASMKSHLLHPEKTPEQVAMSFAIGFSLAFNPLLGLHTALALLACVLSRRLHRPLLILACYINNPWTMVPIATGSAVLGNVLLGRGLSLDLAGIQWRAITWRSFASREGLEAMLRMLKPVLGPYLLGGLVLSLVAVPVGYLVMLRLTRRLRSVHLRLPHLHHPKPPTQQ